MQSPREAMQRLSEQMGWLGQFLGEDFWAHLRSAAEAGANIPMPTGDRGAAPAFPQVDLYVTPTEVVLSAALPGLTRPEQVAVSLPGPTEALLEAFVQPPPGMDLVLQRERFGGYVVRSLPLPVPVVPGGARASYVDGILEIRFARSSPSGAGTDVQILQVPGSGPK